MARFECTLCGRCCSSFGEFITIERQITERDYYCRYGITNELFQAHMEPQFADGFADEFEDLMNKGRDAVPKQGCIFLYRNPDGMGFVCRIYPTRPSICREFICYRMLIYHQESGELRGRIIGINELRTNDEILAALWKEKIAHIPHPFDSSDQATVLHTQGAAVPLSHGHNSHILAHINGLAHGKDRKWVENVISVLAAHGYHGDPVE